MPGLNFREPEPDPPVPIREIVARKAFLAAAVLLLGGLSYFLAFHLPFVRNWPHTGKVYGVLGLLALFLVNLLWKYPDNGRPHTDDIPALLSPHNGKTLLLIFLVLLSLFSLSARSLRERQYAYAFESGRVMKKFLTPSQHRGLVVLVPRLGAIRLENLDAAVWEPISQYDTISKTFGDPQGIAAVKKAHP